MKFTGTKRILIIVLAFICAIATGIGTFFCVSKIAGKNVPPDIADNTLSDEAKLTAVADEYGLRYECVNLYAHATNVSATELYTELGENKDKLADELCDYYQAYINGEVELDKEAEDEDWYIAPDEMSEYAGTIVGLLSVWTSYYTSKQGGYNTDFYWDSNGFTLGRYVRWTTNVGTYGAGDAFIYSFVWLDEGEEFQFGMNCSLASNSVTFVVQECGTFFDNYLKGYWFNQDSSGTYRGSDPEGRTLATYKQEFNSVIKPETTYMSWANSVAATASGTKRVKLSADAPSGVYSIRFFKMGNSNDYRLLASSPTCYSYTNSGCGVWNTKYSTDHMNNWGYYIDYTMVVCRRSVSKPTVQYEAGVNSILTEKRVEFTGDPIKLTLENDWSDGLTYYEVYEMNAGTWVKTTTYNISSKSYSVVSTSKCKMTSRTAKGKATQKSNLVFSATDVGEYKVEVTCFDKWTTGTDEMLTFILEITQKSIEKPTLIDGAGVSGNKKTVNDTGKAQQISMHPVQSKYLNVDKGGLTQTEWTTDGLLILSGTTQKVYTITVSLKNTTNMIWKDGTYGDVTFEFEIGPMLIGMPEVIQDGGVVDNIKTVPFNGSSQIMQFMPVLTTQVNITASNGATWNVADAVLAVTALNAGTYDITITPKPGFGWLGVPTAEQLDPLQYQFVILTKKITAPYLNFPGVTDNNIVVTFGGEHDENGNTWVQPVRFENARQHEINYIAPGMSMAEWGDTHLILTGRAAQTYTMKFECKPNYEWDVGVEPPEVTLVINQLPIDKPYLIRDDGDTTPNVKYETNGKEMVFDFDTHFMELWIGSAAALEISPVATLGEIFPSDDGSLAEGHVKFIAAEAGDHLVHIKPSSNYCWKGDLSSDIVVYKLRISPIGVKPLAYHYFDDTQGMFREVWATDENGWPTVPAATYSKGVYHRVRIGDGTNDPQTGYNTDWHFFEIVDSLGNPLSKAEYTALGVIVDDTQTGYLEVGALHAGTYYVAVQLNKPGYAWLGYNDSKRILYKIIIDPQKISDPVLNRAACGTSGSGGVTFDPNDPYIIHAVYWNSATTLAITLNYEYFNYIEFEFDDTLVTFDSWTQANGLIKFKATDVGMHKIKLKIKDTDYSWIKTVGNKKEFISEYTFTIRIVESPVAGLDISYVSPAGKTDKLYSNLINGEKGAKTVTFSNEDETISFGRNTSIAMQIVDTGFDVQYSYSVLAVAYDSLYQTDVESAIKEENVMVDGKVGGLAISALHAGTYTILIWPSDNYRWNTSSDAIEKTPVEFTLTINRLHVESPVITNSTGYDLPEDELIDTLNSLKTIEYNAALRYVTIDMGDHPDAYASVAWDGIDIGEKEVVGDKNVWSAHATQTGDYRWEIGLSSNNDYSWNHETSAYVLRISYLRMALPEACIVPGSTDFADINSLTPEQRQNLNIQNNYSNSTVYDGSEHMMYVFGKSVEKGALIVTYTLATTNGATEVADKMIRNVSTTDEASYMVYDYDATTFVDGGYNAYSFTAKRVNTYQVTFSFKDSNYVWNSSPEALASGVADTNKPLTYTFDITTKVLDVPKIEGYEYQQLTDNSYIASTDYDFGKNYEINIPNIYFGPVQSDGSYLYINADLSHDTGHDDDSGTTVWSISDYDSDTYLGKITMATGVDGVDEAKVPLTYCVKLMLDVDNERWNTGGSTIDTDNKYFHISITKKSVLLPVIHPDYMTVGNDQYREVIYSGEAWPNSFVVTGVDPSTIKYQKLHSGLTLDYNTDETSPEYMYMTFSAPADVDDYTVLYSLIDTDNLQWIGGSIDDVEYGLRVMPIKIRAVEVYVETTAGAEGVIGNVKTLTYNDEDYTLSVKNYWNDDPNDRWMTYTVVSADAFKETGGYSAAYFPPNDPADEYIEGYKPEFDDYNKGLIQFIAHDAGTYVVEFKLTKNALWLDGSDTPIQITLVIEKKQYETPYINVDTSDNDKTITGNTKTYEYDVDAGGTPVVRQMDIVEYNAAIMERASSTGFAADAMDYYSPFYTVSASLAGTYTITFKIKDFKNNRWTFADTETITFTLEIEKRKITAPEASPLFLLSNERLDTDSDGNSTLTVEYDKREHTILLTNMLGLNYMTYTPAFSGKTSKNNDYRVSYYDEMMVVGTTVGSLFGSTYDGAEKDNYISAKVSGDMLLLTAETVPDTYTISVAVADKTNMCWQDGTSADKVFKVVIEKMEHDAPKVSSGTTTTQQYAGKEVYFHISNVYNGKMSADPFAPVESYAYEQYKVISYEDTKTGTVNDLTYADQSIYQTSWYNGELTLQMVEIGIYTVRVEITPEVLAYTSWRGTAATSMEFKFTIIPRVLGAEFSYVTADEETQANFDLGSNTWCLSTAVSAQLKLSNLVNDPNTGLVDNNINVNVYFIVSSGTTQYNKVLIGRAQLLTSAQLDDGTYTATYDYTLPCGSANISIGSYSVIVEQNTTYGMVNYSLKKASRAFNIIADPAPFKESLLLWRYTYNTDPVSGAIHETDPSRGGATNQRYELPYLVDGGTYTFSLWMNSDGMKGPDKTGSYSNINTALAAWWVKIDKIWNVTAKNAGDYTAYVTISALDSTLFSYPTKTIEFHFRITKAKYDLSKMVWNYSDEKPFTYDTSYKTVAVTGNTYSKLSLTYPNTGSYVTNKQRYAGTYKTLAQFKNTDPNYMTPTYGDESTYTGTFKWECSWKINKQTVTDRWKDGKSTSTGTKVNRTPVLEVHPGWVDYKYRKWDPTLSGGAGGWVNTSTLDRKPGEEVKFEVTATLKTSGGAASYDNNYILQMEEGNDNPLIITLGGNGQIIFTHIEINGTTDTTFEYTGNKVKAQVIIDMNTSDNVITNSNLKINYYVVGSTSPLSSAPLAIGNYYVYVTTSYSGTSVEYVLSQDTFYFSIVKANFKDENFTWKYSHTKPDGTVINAYYDVDQSKWLDSSTDEEVTFVYDGAAHNIMLTSSYALSTLKMSMLGASSINAGTFTATANFIYNTSLYNAPTITPTFTWTVEKATLDMSLIEWQYDDQYIFKLVDGDPVEYTMEIDNLPDYLLDKVNYTTTRDGNPVDNKCTEAADYVTKFAIDTSKIDTANYVVGDLPDGFTDTHNWSVSIKKLDIPESDGSWTQFDGNLHNLVNIFNFDIDWEEYFTAEISYYDTASGASTAVPYDGSVTYGLKYMAYNAGTYSVSLHIKDGINEGVQSNVVWFVPGTGGAVDQLTVIDQSTSLTVAKQDIEVIGWTDDYENSTVIIAGAAAVNKFIGYVFYKGEGINAANTATLDDVLDSPAGVKFTIAPYVKSTFSTNINLTYLTTGNNCEYLVFTTLDLSDRDGLQVGGVDGKPFIYGYKTNGVTTYFNSDELAADHVSVVYSGYPITFLVYNWDDYYSYYLTEWGGDALTQSDAGEYSVTYIFKKDPKYTYYWGKRADGTYDRSSVTLKFEIKYLMIPRPAVFPKNVTYANSAIDIIERAFATSTEYNEWFTKYSPYLTITGEKATKIGHYKLYMSIKEDYLNMVRWSNGSSVGSLETFTWSWIIDPIYLVKPQLDSSVTLTYDGTEHSVYEVLQGYSSSGLSADLQWLMQNARLSVSGSRSIDAGTFTAEFALPNSNYAWSDTSDTASVLITWTIDKQSISLATVDWDYDSTKPFVYAIENGQEVVHTVGLTNIPEVLQPFLSYTTNSTATNGMSKPGTYQTTFLFNYEGKLDTKNYKIDALPDGILRTLEWKIVERDVDAPANDGSWTAFDGAIHSLMEILGYGDSWDNYFDVTVEYALDGSTFEKLDPFTATEETEYSIYNGFRNGSYKLTIKIKDSLVTAGTVRWSDGSTGDKEFTLVIDKLTVTIVNWNEADDMSTVNLSATLTAEEEALFEYVLYESDTLKEITSADITGGVEYTKEWRVKKGYENNIKIEGQAKFTFGNFDYAGQEMVWLPLPKMTGPTTAEFTGDAIEFKIAGWDNDDALTRLYYLDDYTRYYLNWQFNLNLPDTDIRYAYVYGGDSMLKQTAKGEYKVIIRLNSKINLSWYDDSLYYVKSGKLYDIATDTEVTDKVDRSSKTLSFSITEAKVPGIDMSIFEGIDFAIDYKENSSGKVEQDITIDALYKTLFDGLKAQYGSLITFSGNKGTDAGEYTLEIGLSDPKSSYWVLGGSTETVVNIEGFSIMYLEESGVFRLVYAKDNGDGTYTEYNGGNYTITPAYTLLFAAEYIDISADESAYIDASGKPVQQYVVDGSGTPVLDGSGNPIPAKFNVRADGTAVRFDYDAATGKYTVSASGTGAYICRYLVDKDGNQLKELDLAGSSVKAALPNVSTEPYKLKWKIVRTEIAQPTVNTDVKIYYTGEDVNLMDYVSTALNGFDAKRMEIVSGNIGKNAGTYEAKIKLIGSNFLWKTEDGSEPEFITVTWTISKITVTLDNVSWIYTDGINKYTDSSAFEYKRVKGEPVVYWVELDVPAVIKSSIIYTTNGVDGANAGVNAGKYVTTYTLVFDKTNIDNITLPENLSKTITWYINKRTLTIPLFKQNVMIFDDSVHYLATLVDMPEDWEEYYEVDILFSDGVKDFSAYKGYDFDGNGEIEGHEKYLIYGVGFYKFTLSIKTGINVGSLPNVVWLKPKAAITTPGGDKEELPPPSSGSDIEAEEGGTIE